MRRSSVGTVRIGPLRVRTTDCPEMSGCAMVPACIARPETQVPSVKEQTPVATMDQCHRQSCCAPTDLMRRWGRYPLASIFLAAITNLFWSPSWMHRTRDRSWAPGMPDLNCLRRSTTTKLRWLTRPPSPRLTGLKASYCSWVPRSVPLGVTLAQRSVSLQLKCLLGQS